MKRLAPLVLILIALGIAGGGAYLYVSADEAEDGRGWGDGPVSVEVSRVKIYPFADVIEAVGTTRANESVTLTARVSETVSEVRFDDGDYVERDQVLVELDHAEEIADLAEARAAVVEARQQLERTRELVERGNASRAVLDERVRALDQAKARVQAADARIADRIVRAPFDGRLGLRQVSEGALISPGTPIASLDDITPIKLDFAVPERFLSALAQGQAVLAKAAAFPGAVFEGEVATISSRVDPVTRAVTVRAEIANADARLRPGMLLTVELINREREAVGVPEEAIVPVGDKAYIWVIVDDETAVRREVQLGQRRPGLIEILDGVSRGEDVVVAGTMRLRPGSAVRVMDRGLAAARPQS